MISFLSPGSPLQFSAAMPDQPIPVCLFEAGHYKDKGVTISPADLDLVVQRFHSPDGGAVPVNIEHQNGPLDPLGEVVGIYHKEGKLYGAIQFSAGIHQHIKARDAGKFSVGFKLHDSGGFVLDHVAVTATPRVANTGFLNPSQVGETMARFSREGKLTPAMMEPASRLLSAPGIVTFSDGSTGSVAADLIALLEALPVVQPRGTTVPIHFSQPGTNALPPEVADMAKQFGLDPAKVSAQMKGHG